MAGSYGRKDPSGMTRLFVNGTNPPAPSGTAPSESPQKEKEAERRGHGFYGRNRHRHFETRLSQGGHRDQGEGEYGCSSH
jgi:hypothetical protein